MRRILFGQKPDWADLIRSQLDTKKFEPEFRDFRDPLPAFGDFDCVVPFLIEHYEPLRALPESARQNFLVPCERAMSIAGDKFETIRFMHAHGLARFVPTLYGAEVFYPFVYKKRIGGNGENVEIIHTAEQCRHSKLLSIPVRGSGNAMSAANGNTPPTLSRLEAG